MQGACYTRSEDVLKMIVNREFKFNSPNYEISAGVRRPKGEDDNKWGTGERRKSHPSSDEREKKEN